MNAQINNPIGNMKTPDCDGRSMIDIAIAPTIRLATISGKYSPMPIAVPAMGVFYFR